MVGHGSEETHKCPALGGGSGKGGSNKNQQPWKKQRGGGAGGRGGGKGWRWRAATDRGTLRGGANVTLDENEWPMPPIESAGSEATAGDVVMLPTSEDAPQPTRHGIKPTPMLGH